MNLVNKIILEANLNNDLKYKKYADQYISEIKNLIDNYSGNNKLIEYDSNGGWLQIAYKGIKFIFIDYNSPYARKFGGSRAGYDPTIKNGYTTLFLNKCVIKYENSKLQVNFDESSAYHELIHAMQYLRTKNVEQATKKYSNESGVNDSKSYYNDPYEFDAHFQQKIIPVIEKYLKNTDTIPKKYQIFTNELQENIPSLESFFNELDDKFKRKFNKRLGTIYTTIKNANEQLLKLDDYSSPFKDRENSETEENKIKEKSESWWSKLKNYLKRI